MRIIAGPCVHESLELSTDIFKECEAICSKYEIDYYFKASFDKANRTNNDSSRGPRGYDGTMHDFLYMKSDYDIKIVTDIHESHQANTVGAIVDVIQIPALLSRQTDLIQAAAGTGKIINVKKGQWMAPWDIQGILSKCDNAKEVWITERGTSFGYNNLVVDFTGVDYLLNNLLHNFVFDCTHSVQKPGGLGTVSDGDHDSIFGLARAASAMGCSSFFVEVHPEPEKSPSDSTCMLRLDEFDELIEQIMECHYDRGKSLGNN